MQENKQVEGIFTDPIKTCVRAFKSAIEDEMSQAVVLIFQTPMSFYATSGYKGTPLYKVGKHGETILPVIFCHHSVSNVSKMRNRVVVLSRN